MLAATRALTGRAILLVLGTTSLRRAEALGLDWRRTHPMGSQLTVRGRGDEDRPVAVLRDLLAALHALHAQQDFPIEGPVFGAARAVPCRRAPFSAGSTAG